MQRNELTHALHRSAGRGQIASVGSGIELKSSAGVHHGRPATGLQSHAFNPRTAVLRFIPVAKAQVKCAPHIPSPDLPTGRLLQLVREFQGVR